MVGAKMASRYSQFVVPGHQVVDRLLTEAGVDTVVDPHRCDFAMIIAIVRTFRYVNETGHTPLDTVVERRAGNCLSLSCLLTSLLRKVGIPATQVFSMIASPSGFFPTVHAYTLIRREQSWSEVWKVDPEVGWPFLTSVPKLFADYRVFAIFNDSVQLTSQADLKCLVEEGVLSSTADVPLGLKKSRQC